MILSSREHSPTNTGTHKDVLTLTAGAPLNPIKLMMMRIHQGLAVIYIVTAKMLSCLMSLFPNLKKTGRRTATD